MLPKELWLTTNRVSAVVLPTAALSNVWWPTKWISNDEEVGTVMERRLALWFNSTIGLYDAYAASRDKRGLGKIP